MQKSLTGQVVGIMVANSFNEDQMADVQRTLSVQGAKIRILSNENGLVSGLGSNGWGLNFPVDAPLGETLSSDMDMVIVLGGSKSIEKLMKSAHTKRILNGVNEIGIPLILLDEAVQLVTLFNQKRGVSLVAPVSLQNTLQQEGFDIVEEEYTISGNVLSGTLSADHQNILEQILEMATQQAERALAA